MKIRSHALLLSASFIQSSIANRCNFGTRKINFDESWQNYSTAGLVFYSQDEIKTKLQDCTSLVDDINIAWNYTDKIVDLSGITELSTVSFRTVNITELLLSDVEKLDRLILAEDGTRLKSFNASKLVTARYMRFDMSDVKLEFPVLTDLEAIRVERSVKGIFAPNLRTAHEMSFFNRLRIIEIPGYSVQPYDLSFPSLETLASRLEIDGEFTSVSFPKLQLSYDETASGYYPNPNLAGSLDISLDTPLDVSFPSVTSASYVSLRGVSSNPLPQLREIKSIGIWTSLHQDVVFPSLKTVHHVELRGNLTDASFPVLENVYKISISVDVLSWNDDRMLKCSNAKSTQDWRRMHGQWNGTEPCPNFIGKVNVTLIGNDNPTEEDKAPYCGRDKREYLCYSHDDNIKWNGTHGPLPTTSTTPATGTAEPAPPSGTPNGCYTTRVGGWKILGFLGVVLFVIDA